ncbi:hypothetical protein ACJZ2D_012902 [Fusarium nematophilum]
MVGVPYIQRCDQCRKAKRKCDQAQPVCGRCRHLGHKCTGANVRKFVYEHVQVRDPPPASLCRIPSTASMVVAQSLRPIIETRGLPYDITCNGMFFRQFPRRLDSSPALSMAVSAMVETHQSLRGRQLEPSRQALTQQELLWGPVVPTTQHIAMFLRILHKANTEGWLQEFDMSMIASFLPTSWQTFEMALNPDLKPEPWFYDLLTRCYGSPNRENEIICDSVIMVAFAQMPRFNSNPGKHHTQISKAYELLKAERAPFNVNDKRPFIEAAQLKDPINIRNSDMQTLGTYATRLATGSLLNRLLRRTDGRTDSLLVDMDFFCDEIVRASQLAHKFGPLAAGVMPQTMVVVWAASEPTPKRSALEKAVLGYFYHDWMGSKWMEKARKIESRMNDPSLWQDIDQRSYQLSAKVDNSRREDIKREERQVNMAKTSKTI